MAYFTLVMNEVTIEQFEKTLEIKNRAGQKIKFIPQGGQQNQAPSLVGSQNMFTNQTGSLQVIRYEWSDDGVHFGIEILKVLVPKEHHDPKAQTPAAPQS
jgi:hypothetical protein